MKAQRPRALAPERRPATPQSRPQPAQRTHCPVQLREAAVRRIQIARPFILKGVGSSSYPSPHRCPRRDVSRPHPHPLEKILAQRIAIIDGAMGTTIRTYGMKEADIRGERFVDAKKDLLNNGDLFTLTQPAMIGDIHRRFLEAGADIIETNTFGATSIAQSEFFVDDP